MVPITQAVSLTADYWARLCEVRRPYKRNSEAKVIERCWQAHRIQDRREPVRGRKSNFEKTVMAMVAAAIELPED